ncbi:MAG TPA: DMT family transporter [Kiloniellaceae bacterium]|nr:DMT family transporter [Kiloniellaceae bacterium]
MSENTVAVAPLAAVPDRSFHGIVLVAFGISIFSIQDVLIRSLSGGYSVVEIMFIRALVALLPMLVFVHLDGGLSTLFIRRPWLMLLRGLFAVFSYSTYYMAIASLPLSTVTSIFFISPLVVTLLSVVFLRETVGIRRWVGVSIGFAGMLMIVRPWTAVLGDAAINWALLLPLSAAMTYACSIMMTRKLGQRYSGAVLAFYAMVSFLIASSLAGFAFGDGHLADESHPSLGFLLRAWRWPAPLDLAMIAACGGVAAVGFYCLSQGYRLAQASVAAPFEYIALPLSIVWGYAIWNEVPSATTLFGIALIVGGSLYVLRREARRRRKLVVGPRVRLRL